MGQKPEVGVVSDLLRPFVFTTSLSTQEEVRSSTDFSGA
jgi:hypothetical protein